MWCINTEASITTQMSIIQVLRSVNKSLNNQTPRCEYLQKWLYHISTYSKVALTSTKLLVKLTHRLGFLGRRAFGRMFGSFEYFIMYWNDHGCLANIHILYEWFFVLYACYFILHRTRPRHGSTFNGAYEHTVSIISSWKSNYHTKRKF